MVRAFVNSFKFSFTQNANISIYFLKMIPLVGKKIPEKLYKQTHSKIIMGIISGIWGLLCSFFKKFLYLGVMIILPSLFIAGNASPILPEFLHIFFFLSFVLGSLMESSVFDINDMSAFYMITLMKSDPKKYYLGEILYRKLKLFNIFIIIPLLIFWVASFIYLWKYKKYPQIFMIRNKAMNI